MNPISARFSRLARSLALPTCMLPILTILKAQTLDLTGTWRFQLDAKNAGISEHWFEHTLDKQIQLPGTLPAQGIGDPVAVDTKWTGDIIDRSWFTADEYAPYRKPGHIKVPFWLQPETYYSGAAWFQREIEIPASWAGLSINLILERPHWKTTVWLDRFEIGSSDSLSVPHEYELGTKLSAGRHTLTIRVDNTFDPDIGQNSHSISDHTQGNWNGIVGRVELRATAPLRIEDLVITPHITNRVAVVSGRVRASGTGPLPANVTVAGGRVGAALSDPVSAPVSPDGTFKVDYAMPASTPLWDEFTPALQRIIVSASGQVSREATFGLREISSAGRQLKINGRNLFLRGTLDCAAFPRTGHPPMDVVWWRNHLEVLRNHGLNHVRFHSWCPPEAAFVAADELGMYLQIEVASWPNQSTTLGDGKPVDAWMDRETERILRVYGNHPSFIMLCACNEPGGDAASAWLTGWVQRQKARDPRRLYTSGAGWPDLSVNDYDIRAEPRIQHWGEGLESRINAHVPETSSDYREFIRAHNVPVVSHEIGQWCVYPNFAEMPKYTGYLKPRNFEIFRETLAAHGLADKAAAFVEASGKLQALCYKEEIESALRTPEMGGFQLLGLNDFPGQGTALVGVLDAFWEEKGYISPAEFRRFCSATVPLARLEKRVFTSDEHLIARLEIAHFGAAPLVDAAISWKIVDDQGGKIANGQPALKNIPVGAGTSLGSLDVSLSSLRAPAHYKLIVSIAGANAAENDWDFWVYPAPVSIPASPITVVHELDSATTARLESGGTVVLAIPPERVRPDSHKGKIALGFSSIFWNTAWTKQQAPHTLGILCDPKHPALANFPTESHSNWQWWYVVTHAAPMIIDELPHDLRPIVYVIDDWFTNRKLALVLEAQVGQGRLLVTSVDLTGENLDPVRRQLRDSLLKYAATPDFAPTTSVTVQQIQALFGN